MKVNIKEVNGLKFYVRPDTSDAKTVDEVIGRGVYEKRGMRIVAGEKWLDLGANIGAFTLLACSRGAYVESYEPDPISYAILLENIKLNGFKVGTFNSAVTNNNKKKGFLNISPTGQYWRNSLERTLNGNAIDVNTVDFFEIAKKEYCIKMDIEGTEMPILESLQEGFEKLVFEWSFDVDPNIDRYRNVLGKMRSLFSVVKADEIRSEHKVWLKSWFPPCKNVYCWK
jgi:FkbM family methyltransferase